MSPRVRRLVVAAAAAFAACAGAACTFDPAPHPPGDDGGDDGGDDAFDGETNLMRGFSWVTDGLAGMPSPGLGGVLEANLDFLADEGIDLLVSLTEAGVDREQVEAHGLRLLHLPVVDFTAPSPRQLEEFTVAARQALARGEAVGVHCGAGYGRTGTMLAAYFVTEGLGADAAIALVRARRPGSIETASQEQAIREFSKHARGDRFDVPRPDE